MRRRAGPSDDPSIFTTFNYSCGTRLRIPAAAVQVPIGVEDRLEGVVGLVRWKAIYNKGTNTTGRKGQAKSAYRSINVQYTDTPYMLKYYK
jgi:hypothetical protein